jgi:hypothetical protein
MAIVIITNLHTPYLAGPAKHVITNSDERALFLREKLAVRES